MPSAIPVDRHDVKICIIGAGMGGLASALSLAKAGFRDIQVFETASSLGFVGAGIQLAPNLSRILDKLGVWQDIEKEAVAVNETSIREGSNEREHAHMDLTYIRKAFGYQHMVGHRATLAGALYEGCKRESKVIKFNFATSAGDVDVFAPQPSFTAMPRHAEPYHVEADILLAADGVKSSVRRQMMAQLGTSADVKDTGQAAYRIMLRRDQMAHDPKLLELIDGNQVTRWIGEKRHIIAYPVSHNTLYNLSTVQPDGNFAAAPSETYTTKGDKSAMLTVFADFCPRVRRMLDLVPEGEVCEWKLRVHAPLPTWVHGSIALVGDACHPTLPHLNQGAAQAIEDAAVIGVVLGKLPNSSPESINKALRVYESVRKERAETLVNLAAASGRDMHLGDGEAKKARDKLFAEASKGGPLPDKWADASVQRMIFGHNCAKVADEQFDQIYASMEG